mgnify:FL=1
MITDCQAGATVTALASTYACNRVGVSDALKQAGVQLRRRGLTPAQVDEALLRYAGGMSLVRIGARLDFDAATVRSRLRERGVAMRLPNERPLQRDDRRWDT